MRLAALALASVALASCTSIRLPAGEEVRLDPIAYFAGWASGTGLLRVPFSSPKRVVVESEGSLLRSGELRLRQRIQQGEDAPRWREWRIVRVGPNRYTGTLTDAAGPVTITSNGPRAQIAYRMANGMQVRQQLALQADGRTLLNHLTVSRFGVRIARVDETIRKLD